MKRKYPIALNRVSNLMNCIQKESKIMKYKIRLNLFGNNTNPELFNSIVSISEESPAGKLYRQYYPMVILPSGMSIVRLKRAIKKRARDSNGTKHRILKALYYEITKRHYKDEKNNLK